MLVGVLILDYCKRCNKAGSIAHLYLDGQVGCFYCGSELEDQDYEWIKSKEAEVTGAPLSKKLESTYP
jgi:hypothetical protein